MQHRCFEKTIREGSVYEHTASQGTNGDIKATQGDTGHSEIEMITKVYAHILDEDRKLNAQKFDSEFYSNPDLRKVSVPSAQPVSAEQLLAQLKESPDLLNSLAKLLAGSITSD